MKPAIALLFCLQFVILIRLGAQAPWAPPGAHWYYCQGTGLGSPECGGYYYYEVSGDTVVAGRSCRKISGYQKDWRNKVTQLPERYSYAENDSVYVYRPDFKRFLLTYDFRAQAGDTLSFPAPQMLPWIPSDTAFQVRVDSIVWRQAGAEQLRFFYTTPLGAANWWFFGGWYAESIGGKMLESPFPAITIPEIDGYIRCYADSAASIQFSQEPCDYTLSGWFGEEASWYYGYSSFSLEGYEHMALAGDTTIQGWPCKVVQRTVKGVYQFLPGGSIVVLPQPDRFVYDVADRVYAWQGDAFVKLYDFSLNPGDSLQFPEAVCGEIRGYVIDSVGATTVEGVPLRYQRAHILAYGPEPERDFTILERMGAVYWDFQDTSYASGYFFLDEWLSCGTETPGWSLRCYSDADIKDFRIGARPCDFILSTVDKGGSAGVDVFPNPVGAQLTIRFEAPGTGNRYALTDLPGCLLRSGALPDAENTVHTADLAAGVYLLRVWTKTGIFARVLVKQ